jgi:type I restriction enzyme, S subunit
VGMTDAIDLTTEQRNVLTALVRRFLPGVAVWAYGSRVKWTARPNSDLDLVAFATPAQRPQVADLKDALAESNLPFPVDLHVWDEVPERFREIIRKEYVVVQGAKEPTQKQGVAGKWNEMKLGDAIELKRGYDLPNRERRDGPFPIVSSSGISGRHAETKAKAPGVVIGRYGTLGEVHYVTEDYWPLNTALYVRDFKGNDPRFISYFLRTLDFSGYSDKAAVPGLNRNDLHTAQVSLPPCEEQHAIAHILGTLDDKIELNRRMNETLEAMARALFKSWFVDFDPVRAKAEGREPGLPKSLADLFPDSFDDSEMGEIPKGWSLGTLADFASLNPEAWSKETRPVVLNYVDLSNTKWGRIEAVMAYAQRDEPSRAQRILRPGDTIVGMVRPGNGSYAFIAEEGLTGSTGFAVLRPLRVEFAEFMYLAATARENISALSHLADGGAYPAVRPEDVAITQAIKSSDDVIKKFSQLAGALLAAMASHERESRTLAALRDTLLPKLISGEICVNRGETIVKGVA